MTGPGKGLWGVGACSFGLLAWLYGGDVLDFFRAKGAQVSALSELPRLWFALVVLFAALAGAVAFGAGLWRRQGPAYRGYRLLPIVALIALFVDLFALSGSKVPIGSADHLSLSLQLFAQQAQALATTSAVPDDPAALSALLPSLGEPPFLVEGARQKAYSLQLRSGCQGPAKDAPGAQVGTFIYCVGPDRRTAWVTAVALAGEVRFGPPAIFTRGAQLQAVVITAAAPDEPPEPDPGEAPAP
ncbi:MAG: hypothetical protein ACYC8T_31370 [Myxococcaceae bacterium]